FAVSFMREDGASGTDVPLTPYLCLIGCRQLVTTDSRRTQTRTSYLQSRYPLLIRRRRNACSEIPESRLSPRFADSSLVVRSAGSAASRAPERERSAARFARRLAP